MWKADEPLRWWEAEQRGGAVAEDGGEWSRGKLLQSKEAVSGGKSEICEGESKNCCNDDGGGAVRVEGRENHRRTSMRSAGAAST